MSALSRNAPQLETFLENYRSRAPRTLNGLDEDQFHRRLVASDTTLLGLVKHITFVETVWFDSVVTGTPRGELGPASSAESFLLGPDDTIKSVRARHREVCAGSRERMADFALDDTMTDRDGRSMTVRFLYLQCLAEYAHRTGHADILREQLLDE